MLIQRDEYIGVVPGVIRALRADLQDQSKMALAQKPVFVNWIVEHLAWALQRFRGVLVEQRITAKEAQRTRARLWEVGDSCEALKPEKEGTNNRTLARCATFQPRFEKCVAWRHIGVMNSMFRLLWMTEAKRFRDATQQEGLLKTDLTKTC